MSRTLAVSLALLCALSASAQTPKRKRTKVAPPRTTLEDAQAFDQTFDFILAQAGQSYLKDQAMPDPVALDAFIANLKEPELSKAKQKRQRLEEILSGAEWVQQGGGGVAPDVYKLMIDQAADDLGVGTIVESDFAPNERAGREIDDAEKQMSAACRHQGREHKNARSYYQQCLGRLKSEQVYLDPSRKGAANAASLQSPAAARLLQEIQTRKPKLAPNISDEIARKMKDDEDKLIAGARTPASGAGPGVKSDASHESGHAAPGQSTAQNKPPQPDGFKTTPPPMYGADLAAGTKLAHVVQKDEIGFTGYCYSYVKSALQKAGIVDRDTIAKANEHRRAAQFNDFVQKNPGLLKRKLLRVPNPAWPLPIGTIVVWSPGACNYSDSAGHIEIVTRIKPPQACSDGCGTFQVACLEELAMDPGRAKLELPTAQKEFDDAQATLDGAQGRAAKRKAAVVFSQKKRVLDDVKARLEPQVAAYVIER